MVGIAAAQEQRRRLADAATAGDIDTDFAAQQFEQVAGLVAFELGTHDDVHGR